MGHRNAEPWREELILLRFHLRRLLRGADAEGGRSGVKIATALANFKTEMHKLFPNLLQFLNPEASKSYLKKLMLKCSYFGVVEGVE